MAQEAIALINRAHCCGECVALNKNPGLALNLMKRNALLTKPNPTVS